MRHQLGIVFRVALLALAAAQLSCHDLSGVAGDPTSVTPVSSATQDAAPGTNVSDPPSVVVRDNAGTPLRGVTVTFAVTSGGGSVTGGTEVTNASGVATVGSWTIGSGLGANTLDAMVGSLPPITFTANGSDSPCFARGGHSLGGATSGALTILDCHRTDGRYVDYLNTRVTTADTYLFTMSSDDFDAFLALFDASGTLIGSVDDFGLSLDPTIKTLLPPGDYTLAATAFKPDSIGNYTLTSAATSATVTNCEDVFVVRGISSAQSLQSSDCVNSGFYDDDYFIYLVVGQPVTLSMNSTAFDSKLGLFFYPTGALVALNDNKNTTTHDAQLTYTPPYSGFYVVAATSAVAGASGIYTITIQ